MIDRLRTIVGRRHVLVDADTIAPFAEGYRFGNGSALAVVKPGTLVEQWRALQACVQSDVIVIFQAANTGLTGGSTPDGDYDRPVVIINTMRIRGLHLIDGGRQVVCLPGTTLVDLERTLAPLDREPHSVIGSSCIGASVFGGICNNSGGSLIRRGPAYSELALYAQVDAAGQLRLINHLGIALGDHPEEMLDRLDRHGFAEAEVEWPEDRRASDGDYQTHVRRVDAPTPARFNADPSRLFEASGSAGRVALFAVRLDTFAKPTATATFYIGTSDPRRLTTIRRHILTQFTHLPVSGEYMHRDAFDVAATYGKDSFLAIERLGTARLPMLLAWKNRFDRLLARVPFVRRDPADRLLQWLGALLPDHLPPRMVAFRRRFDHHLLLKMEGGGIAEARRYLDDTLNGVEADVFECSPEEDRKAFLHRFAAAGAAVRYRAVHADTVEDIVALDVALRRDDPHWFEPLPAALGAPVLHALYYGHFFCHVFHWDYILKKGSDTHGVEAAMLESLDRRGAEYPAEHNVGHLYPAKPALADHYRELDPRNVFNPGIGKTDRTHRWGLDHL
nr:D-lactate dehydrogenase [Sphingomonas liriopis]